MLIDIITNPIVSMLIGAVITLFVSRYYYSKASKELGKASDNLYKISRLILEALQHEGRFNIVYGKDRFVVDIRRIIDVESIPSEEAFGTPTFISHPPKEGQSKSKDIQNDSDITVHFDNKLE